MFRLAIRFLSKVLQYGLLSLFLVSLPFLWAFWQVFSHYDDAFDENAACAVVFGAAVWRGDTPSHALDDRIQAAVDLYQNQNVSCLIMSGGASTFGSHEVDVMKKIATEQGVKPTDLILDYEGYSTAETVANLPDGVTSFVFVSQDFHLGRIMLMAKRRFDEEKVNYFAHAAPYQKGRLTREPFYVMRETAGIIYFILLDKTF